MTSTLPTLSFSSKQLTVNLVPRAPPQDPDPVHSLSLMGICLLALCPSPSPEMMVGKRRGCSLRRKRKGTVASQRPAWEPEWGGGVTGP